MSSKQLLNHRALMEKYRQAISDEEKAEIIKEVALLADVGFAAELSEEDLDIIAGGTNQQGLYVCECLLCGWRSPAASLEIVTKEYYYNHLEHRGYMLILPADS